MSKVSSVDFKIIASGYGVVNWNGTTELRGPDGKNIKNHNMPKLRGYTPYTGEVKEETGFKYRKTPDDVDFSETPLYISANCVKHFLYKENSHDQHFLNKNNKIIDLLPTLAGLFRGYVNAASGEKRSASLLLEDFVEQLGNGNYEQFSTAGEKDKNSIFSKITFGDTEYISYGTINIENLQFISLDQKFDKKAVQLSNKSKDIKDFVNKIGDFIVSLQKNDELLPQVTYHENFVRTGTIFNEGERGILLNSDAIYVLVEAILNKLRELYIRQAHGYMIVDEIIVDYNDSKNAMRIKRDELSINSDNYQIEYKDFFKASEIG